MKSLDKKGYTLNLAKSIPDDILKMSKINKDIIINNYKKIVFVDFDDYKNFGKKYYGMTNNYENTNNIDDECGMYYISMPMFHLQKKCDEFSMYKNHGFSFAIIDDKKFLCAKIKGLEINLEINCETIYNDEKIIVVDEANKFTQLMER